MNIENKEQYVSDLQVCVDYVQGHLDSEESAQYVKKGFDIIKKLFECSIRTRDVKVFDCVYEQIKKLLPSTMDSVICFKYNLPKIKKDFCKFAISLMKKHPAFMKSIKLPQLKELYETEQIPAKKQKISKQIEIITNSIILPHIKNNVR